MLLTRLSLQARLTAWSTVFTLLCLGTCGIGLNVYLRYALSSSRSDSMRKREHRLLRYLESDLRSAPDESWQEHMEHFLEATPETDLVEIDSEAGTRLFPRRDPAPGLHRDTNSCLDPCLTTVLFHGHHLRILTHATTVANRRVRLTLIGSIDEHYDILQAISEGFLGLVPFILLGSVLGGYGLSRQALAPVGAMTTQARHLSLTNLKARISEVSTGDELQELAHAWNDMLDRLESSATSITRFTADASHDLRTSITVILANAQLALRRQRAPERYQETLNSIVTESTHMLDLLEDMLLTARAGGSFSASLTHAQVNLVEIVREVADSVAAGAALSDHDLRLEISHPELWLSGDRTQLRRLVSILVDNAIKYTPAGGRIHLRLLCQQPAWSFAVIDTGIGIAPELQGRIFERLFRADPVRNQGTNAGHGLGLTIALWIAAAHDLHLELQSAPDQGTTFTLRPSQQTAPAPLYFHQV